MDNQPVVLITGASRGLGAATAKIAANWGARVSLVARSTEDLEGVAQQINQSGGTALAVPADISSAEDCHRIIQKTIEAYGQMDALINNGGQIEPISPLADVDLVEWERSLQVNLFGAVMLTHLSIQFLRQKGGRLIFISSGAAQNVIPGWSAYSVSKAALNLLTRILAEEEPAITSLAVRPGVVDTKMQVTIRQKGKGHMAERNYDILSGMHAQNKLLPPERPGLALAALALYAPAQWSGEVIGWDDPRVLQLIGEKNPHPQENQGGD